MISDLSLTLVSPDKDHFIGNIEMVVLPGEEGDFTVLPEHAPIITYLRPGRITFIDSKKKEHSFFVATGFVKVDNDDCNVMVDYIKKKEDLDKDACKKELALVQSKIDNNSDVHLIERLQKEREILEEELNFIDFVN